MAKGNYIKQKKDSVWLYFTENDSLKSVENYKAGNDKEIQFSQTL
jgi:antitoxin component YwqK of YwqJK toxin-antitoxin module